MPQSILVHPSRFELIYACEHALRMPHTNRKVVLCEACMDELNAGGEILKLTCKDATLRFQYLRGAAARNAVALHLSQ